MKRAMPIILVALFLGGLFIVPVGKQIAIDSGNEILLDTENDMFETLSIFSKSARIALYNTTDPTVPGYMSGDLELNNTEVFEILESAGHQVTRITLQDIQNHELLTRNYDILVLSDSCPPVNISELVKDFWEGGGSILSFDSSIEYLAYAGILPRESAGSNGQGVYWSYISNAVGVVNERHPAAKSYSIADELTYDGGFYAMFDWSALQTTSIGDDLFVLAVDDSNSNQVVALAADARDKGGRIVQIGIPSNSGFPDWYNLIEDSIVWLTPAPKARIAFDLSHFPVYGVDAEDSSQITGLRYGTYRDSLVNNSYTFDKFYGDSENNITLADLNKYDMFILNNPEYNFTATEVADITTWVEGGGGLFAIGENTAFATEAANLGYLLNDFGLHLSGLDYDTSSFSSTDYTEHPITERVGTAYFTGGVYVTISGTAESVWTDGSDVVIGAQQWGDGRILLIGDVNCIGSQLDNDNNIILGANIAHWLTSGSSNVLVYTNEPVGEDYWTGKYVDGAMTPVGLALNEIGIVYEFCQVDSYFNRSLFSKDWDLVIIDAPATGFGSFLDEVEQYVDAGGRLIMSWYNLHSFPTHSLWAKLGFNYTGAFSSTVPTYIWQTSQDLFSMPIDYGANNYTGSRDYGTTGEKVDVFDNATALAGYSETATSGNASIILRNDRKTLYNSYLIDQYSDDTDDSTYEDRFELWLNEIAFMMAPTIDSPADVSYEVGTTGHSITWTPYSYSPDFYAIAVDGVVQVTHTWSGSSVVYSIDGLAVGEYQVAIGCEDSFGFSVSDTVMVNVTATPVDTETDTTTDGTELPFGLDITTLIIIVAAVIGLLIVIVIISKKRGASSKPKPRKRK